MRKIFLTILAVLLLAVVGFTGTLSGLYDIPVMIEKPIVEPLPDETPTEGEGDDQTEQLPDENDNENQEVAMLSETQEVVDETTEGETEETETTDPETPTETPEEPTEPTTPDEPVDVPEETPGELPEETPEETPEAPKTEQVSMALGLYLTEQLHFTKFLNAVGEGLYKTIFFIIAVIAAVLFGVTLTFIFRRKKRAPKNPNPPVYPPHYQERTGPETVDAPKQKPSGRGLKF